MKCIRLFHGKHSKGEYMYILTQGYVHAVIRGILTYGKVHSQSRGVASVYKYSITFPCIE